VVAEPLREIQRCPTAVNEAMEQLLAAIERHTTARAAPIVVALDGRSGTGKSTLAKQLAAAVDTVIVGCDDFYAGGTDEEWLARTPRQRAACCIDWRRLEDEAVEPLRDGRIAHYHPSDFNNGAGLAPHVVTCDPKSVIILDGAYSGRPELAEIVDIAVLIELPDGLRRSRLLAREGAAFMNRWHPIWDLAEDYYFAHVCPPSRYDFVFAIFA